MATLSDRCKIFVSGENRVDLIGLMSFLHGIGIKRLMVEGGAILNWSMVSAGFVDEIYVYIGNMLIGGKSCSIPGGRRRILCQLSKTGAYLTRAAR